MPGPNAGISYPPPPLETRDTEPAPPLDRNFTPAPDTLRAVRPPFETENEPEVNLGRCPHCGGDHG
jgi:hypothetical protein